nr:hypothetical protein [Lactiplantibacillus plantarum]
MDLKSIGTGLLMIGDGDDLEMNAALTIEQQAQIGQDFIADIMELSERGIGSETNDD